MKCGFSTNVPIQHGCTSSVAEIKPGESVSVCFSTAGAYGYWVQSQPTTQGGAGLGGLNMPMAMPAAVIVNVEHE
jgi:hypothetical protein